MKKSFNYKIGWLAALLASNVDYKFFTFDHDGISFSEGKGLKKIPYLAIYPGIAIERGYFWNVLAIHLDDGNIHRFGGISNRKIGLLQKVLNQLSKTYIKGVYEKIAPDIQQAYHQAQLLFFKNDYIRYPVAKQWLDTYQYLSDSLKHRNIHKYIEPDILHCLQIIQPIVN